MKISIMQPTFNPWLGYFDLIDKVDLFVFYDDVQLVKRSWQTRNRIKSPNGDLFLSIPIRRISSRDDTLIMSAQIDVGEKWISKHLRSFELYYKKAEFFEEVYAFLKEFYEKDEGMLSNFNISIIKRVAERLGIETKTVRSSEMEGVTGAKDSRLLSICQKLDATEYLSPQGSADYIEEKSCGGELAKNGIDVFYHVYEHPVYRQLWMPFSPSMGIVDLLFNEGFQNALTVIRAGRMPDIASA